MFAMKELKSVLMETVIVRRATLDQVAASVLKTIIEILMITNAMVCVCVGVCNVHQCIYVCMCVKASIVMV